MRMTKRGYRGRGRGHWRDRVSAPAPAAPAPAAPVPPDPVPYVPTSPDPVPASEDTMPTPAPEFSNQPSTDLGINEQDISSSEIDSQDISNQEMNNQDMNGSHMHDSDMNIKADDQEGETVLSDNDVSMQEEKEQKSMYKPPWWRPKGTRLKRKRKKVPGVKNRRIKKYAQPKNAVMCLNELKPGISYVTEQEGGISRPFCVSVSINGQEYRGFGSSKQLAKQAAAEAALISFVNPPVATTDNVEDKTPWTTIVSFAMYKLFNEWRDGRVGMCPPPSHPLGAVITPGPDLTGKKAVFMQPAVSMPAAIMDGPQDATLKETISAHLGNCDPSNFTSDPKTTEPKILPNPAKQIPENASTMHPVMLLHQMKPGMQFNVNETVRDNRPFFITTSTVDDKEFSGEGTSVKKSKLSLAKAAIQGLYGIESTFEC